MTSEMLSTAAAAAAVQEVRWEVWHCRCGVWVWCSFKVQ